MNDKQAELENMSDHEINCLILKSRHPSGYRVNANYCNDPSDIMPLAIEKLIDLSAPTKKGGDWEAAFYFCESDDKTVMDIFSVEHANPYRAIAIVFLLMQGNDHD